MNKLISAILFILILSGCKPSVNVNLKKLSPTILEESEQSVITEFPEYIQLVNDSKICFKNDIVSILVYDVNSGVLKNKIIPAFDAEPYLNWYNSNRKEKVERTDLSKHNEPFYRNFIPYRIENFTIVHDTFYIYYYHANPILYKQAFHLEMVPIFLKTDELGNVQSFKQIEGDYYQSVNYGFSPFLGFMYNPEKNEMFTYAMRKKLQNKAIYAAKLSLSGKKYVLSDTFSFDFPEDIYRKQDVEDKVNLMTFEQFFEFKGKWYFLNSKEIFDLETRKLVFKCPKHSKDSLSAIYSFFIMENPENKKPCFIIQYEVLKRPYDSPMSQKYLYVADENGKMLSSKIWMGQKTSRIDVRNNTVYYVSFENDQYLLKKIKISFNKN